MWRVELAPSMTWICWSPNVPRRKTWLGLPLGMRDNECPASSRTYEDQVSSLIWRPSSACSVWSSTGGWQDGRSTSSSLSWWATRAPAPDKDLAGCGRTGAVPRAASPAAASHCSASSPALCCCHCWSPPSSPPHWDPHHYSPVLARSLQSLCYVEPHLSAQL